MIGHSHGELSRFTAHDDPVGRGCVRPITAYSVNLEWGQVIWTIYKASMLLLFRDVQLTTASRPLSLGIDPSVVINSRLYGVSRSTRPRNVGWRYRSSVPGCPLLSRNSRDTESVQFLPRLGCNLTIVPHSANWRPKTGSNIAIFISADQLAIISLHRVKIRWDSLQWPRSLRRKKLYGRRW